MRTNELVFAIALALLLLPAVGCDSASSQDESDTAPPIEDGRGTTDLPGSVEVGGEDLSPEELYPGEPGAAAVFKVNRESFYDQPFPSDTRLRMDGSLNLQDYPNPGGLELLDDYVKMAEMRVHGYSNNGAIYFRFDGPLAPLAFPAAYETLDAGAEFFLVNISADSEFYGEFIPVEAWYWDREAPYEGYYLEPYLLAIRPLGGFPMRPGQTYAAVVTRRLTDAQGRYLAANETVTAALSDKGSATFHQLYEPLGTWLDESEGIARSDVAVATVFTVQDPVDEMVRTAEWIRENVEVELAGPVEEKPTGNDYLLYEGTYVAPNFQTGEPPYFTDGEIQFDADGDPKVQWLEEITFAVAIPKGQTMPSGGWPLVMYSHGTGGSYKSFTYSTAEQFTDRGIAVIGIDQPLHGKRYDGPSIDVEFYSFNFTNPWGARSLFRQAGLDFVTLGKLVSEMTFSVGGNLVRFDGDKLGYFGHSQGGLTGALYLAVADNLRAAVLSGAGGGLTYTILLRKELDSGTTFDIKTALEAVLGLVYEDEFTEFHPVLTLTQTLVEATDPLNYSPYYIYPRFVEKPVNVLITEGVEDPYTPAITTENLAIAGGIPPLSPMVHPHPGFDLRGLQPESLPVSQNVQAADGPLATAAVVQFNDWGHFVAFDDATCRAYVQNFLDSGLNQSAPVLDK